MDTGLKNSRKRGLLSLTSRGTYLQFTSARLMHTRVRATSVCTGLWPVISLYLNVLTTVADVDPCSHMINRSLASIHLQQQHHTLPPPPQWTKLGERRADARALVGGRTDILVLVSSQ